MDTLEKLTKKRIGHLKIYAVILVLYSVCALGFFALNALGLIDVFGVAEYETNRLMQFSSMGTCTLGILSGVLCIVKGEDQNWYNILYVLCTCTIVLNAFVTTGHISQDDNFMATVVMFGTCIVSAFCATIVYRLRASATKL